MTGTSWDAGSKFDYATIKYDSAGAELWAARYDGPGDDDNDDDIANALAVDAAGNVYVTGVSLGESYYDYATIKYDSAGNELWAARYNGPGDGYDIALALAVDAAGQVHVTGRSVNDYATIKYDAEGNVIWTASYNGPGTPEHPCGCPDTAYALAVDGVGNVYVTGASLGESGYDYATAKYDAAGVELWVARYKPGPGNDLARALKVDAVGNAYVTGISANGSNVDYATVKYDSAGNELWAARYNGPGDGYDDAQSLAIDAADNVYVTGWSWNGSDYDYATVKYFHEQSSDANTNGIPDECEDQSIFCANCAGDTNGDGLVDGDDIAGFVDCLLIGAMCGCTDTDGDNQPADADGADDLAAFVSKLLTDSAPACP